MGEPARPAGRIPSNWDTPVVIRRFSARRVAVREVLDELVTEWREGKSTALGTVVSTYRSAPRPAGASMLVTSDERAVGSV
ncbi:MAG: XdhC family protein, partial [Pseudonocardiaceae bacterium]